MEGGGHARENLAAKRHKRHKRILTTKEHKEHKEFLTANHAEYANEFPEPDFNGSKQR
jgi:hypothetical protein